jgi:hypothetical protein
MQWFISTFTELEITTMGMKTFLKTAFGNQTLNIPNSMNGLPHLKLGPNGKAH